jgi:tetratricopeptide (TPR) repeat protein
LRKQKMKALYIFLVSFGLAASGCSSIPNNESSDFKKMGKSTQDRIQAINSELSLATVPEERKQQLKLDKAKILLDYENYDEATILLKEVLQSNAKVVNPSEVNLYLGKAYYGKSDYGVAIGYLSTSEKLDRNYNDRERKKMVAKSLYEEKEYYPALAALSKAYKGSEIPKDHFYYETAAQTYFKMGYTNKSIDFYKRSLQVTEMGLKEYPNSTSLSRIQKDCLQILGSH